MTRDEILNMPAGEEMDDLVAEKYCPENVGYSRFLKFNPSTEIESAWAIVEKIKKSGDWMSVTTSLLGADDQWCCEYSVNNVNSEVNIVLADTAPLAISRAALILVMDK